VSSTPAVCTAAGQNVTCDLGDLPAAGVQTIEITAMVAPSVAPGTVITNAAAVESATNDPNPLDNAPAPTSGPPVTAAADLSVTKAPPSELVAGAESAWTITVTNDGPSEARDVVVSDTLDPALSFASSAPPICTATGQGVTCNVGTLGAGVSTSVVVSTVVAADRPAGTVITNSAGVASSTPDPDPVDNLAPPIAGEVEAQADAAIDVDIAPEQVRQGAELTIDVTVANDGPSAAVDAGALFALGEHLRLIRDNGGFSAPAPAQALGSGVRPAGEPCASSGATLRCAAANLLAGETARAAITVRVGTAVPIGTRITLRANLTVGTADGNTTNNSDQDSVVIVAALAQPTPTTSPPTTSPPTTSPPAQPATPFTGLEVTGLLVAAVVLLGLGTAAMAGARRRRAQSV
jgi:uncharacterized repeat protein (TIGR01451 family)